jgi:spore coat protein U-like protein
MRPMISGSDVRSAWRAWRGTLLEWTAKIAVALLMLLIWTPSLEARCTYVAVPSTVSFGNYSVFSTNALTTTFIVQIRCNPQSGGTLTLSKSATNDSFNPRAMGKTTERVGYNVFLDAAGSQIFGDGQGGTSASVSFNSTPRDKVFDIPMYFRTTVGEDVTAGTYTDTLTLTLDPLQGNETPTRTFTVTTVVVPECQVETFTLPFGAYDAIGAHGSTPLDANMTVNVLCTKGVQATTSLSAGNNPSGSSRQMAFGPHRLPYNVFINSPRTTIWNSLNTISAASTSKSTPLGGGLIGFGRIPPGQLVAAGDYVDTLIATVTY